jgi:hypothetical protein
MFAFVSLICWVIPIFSHEVMARRPDGKPTKLEELTITVTMYFDNQQEKQLEIKEFSTRGRNDLAFFNVEFHENCLGVLMTINPMNSVSQGVPFLPFPRHQSAKLTIELLPSTIAPPLHTDVPMPMPVIRSRRSVGRSNISFLRSSHFKESDRQVRIFADVVRIVEQRSIDIDGSVRSSSNKRMSTQFHDCRLSVQRHIAHSNDSS